jgi:hypothetical protein
MGIKHSGHMVKAFCVGQAKSGTASLFGLLSTHHRAAHEPERESQLELILRESRGEVSDDHLRDYLLDRDRHLNIEYDIAWENQFISDHLLSTFPEAKFIVLVRDPYSWLRSIVGHLISREIPGDVLVFLDWWFKPDEHPHSKEDKILEARGLYSLQAFLNAWNQHINICTQRIPSEKRLVLRTHEINRSLRKLAEFLEIPIASLDTHMIHMNRSTWSGKLDSLVEEEYLNEIVVQICGDNMARHFPEVRDAKSARQLWKNSFPNG